jgi:FAD/FMN-containing dehydrogenase
MEYSVPAEHGPACFRALRSRMRERHPEVVWPVEYRSLAADNAWLSPAYERDTVTLSVHQDGRLPFEDFFADVEPILANVGGRPHWGKVHTLGQRELQERYPRFDAFCERRQQLDPKGRFLNDYLRGIFAP